MKDTMVGYSIIMGPLQKTQFYSLKGQLYRLSNNTALGAVDKLFAGTFQIYQFALPEPVCSLE